MFGAIACLTIVPGQADFLGTIYAFGAMLSFTVAHLAVVALRVKQPDVERPVPDPGNVALARAPSCPLLVDHRRRWAPGSRSWWSRC